MQPHQPLLPYRKPTPLTAVKMLIVSLSSSTTFSSSPNPNPNPNLNLTLHRPTMKSTSETTINTNNNKIPNFPFFSNPKITLTNSNNFTQSHSFSKCFSAAATSTNAMSSPVPISKRVEKGKIVNDEVGLEQPPPPPLVVVSFYKFASFPDHAVLRKPLKVLCEQLRVSGGIILAPEGINGSICGTRDAVEKVLAFIQMDDRLRGLRRLESPVSPEEEAIHHGHSSSSPLAAGEDAPFRWDHVRVKLKKEIVTLGMPSVSPNERVGKYVNPKDWNALISDPDTVVVDVRNDYETRIGKFKGAVDPCTTAFRKFPSWVEERLMKTELDGQVNTGHSTEDTESEITDQVNPGHAIEVTESESAEKGEKTLPRVAMYCTGGIRCEKATSYLLSKGFKEVYHLEGGILKYLEEVPKTESLWEGECFVFDKRVSVEHGLAQGTFKLCYGCKQPVSDADMESPEWEYAVSCPYCYSSKSEEEKERARARQRQFEKWGIIGGPDKGRKPVKSVDGDESSDKQISNSI